MLQKVNQNTCRKLMISLEIRSIDKLTFDSYRAAFCVKLDRKRIIDDVMNHKRIGGKNLEKGKVYRTFNTSYARN